jgi:RNA polymerase sigma factor (sigma-70 family)
MSIEALYREAKENRRAEEQLFLQLSARFHLFARRKIRNRQDCDEVVQDALTAIIDSYRSIDFTVSFGAWAHRILENKIVDYFRSAELRKARFTDAPVRESAADAGTDSLKHQLRDCLRKVNTASSRHARLLVLKYQGYTFDEICSRMKLTRSNAYSMLSRARAMLEDCLRKGDKQ